MSATSQVVDGVPKEATSTAQSDIFSLRNIAGGATLAAVSGALAYSLVLKRANLDSSTNRQEVKLGPPVQRQSHEDPEVLKALAATRTSHMKAYDDCKTIDPAALDRFLKNQNRYEQLVRRLPEHAAELQRGLKKYIMQRHKQLLAASAEVVHAVDDLTSGLGAGVRVYYASDTGTTEQLAKRLSGILKRRGVVVKTCRGMDELDLADSANSDDLLVLMTSTCGDGDMPSAATTLWEQMLEMNGSQKLVGRFCVFGLGDSSYEHFCAAAVQLDAKVAELGMTRAIPLAKGDDRAEDGWATTFDEWLPRLCGEVGAKPEDEEEYEAIFEITSFPVTAVDKNLPYQRIVPPGSLPVPVLENRRLTPESYERDIRHIALDVSATDLPFRLGDALTLYPKNLESDVDVLFNEVVTHLDRNEIVSVKCLSDDVPARLRSAFKARMPVKQIFVELLDIFGKPGRSFYRQLARLSRNSEEAGVLRSIADSDDKFKELLDLSVSFADVLRRFPKSAESMTLVSPCLEAVKNDQSEFEWDFGEK
ncbi:hypothetical protein FOZ60_013347 [Perkinsus olseni]|uniref:Flavodoxin-like domain-containing protein n=1 Tax=Perkinsus olseni TaxID=32597 RepID=A0A7J6PMN3_PEROL|nr:hypothetical protein FOZ60_013347 [Perkinsus olseni]